MRKYLFLIAAAILMTAVSALSADKRDVSGYSGGHRMSQKKALTLIYKATNGTDWTVKDGWCTKKPISKWYGVKTDRDGNVISIDLHKNNLSGSLPNIFCAFPMLKSLNLSNNDISGQVPPSLAGLPVGFKANLSRNIFETTVFNVPDERIEIVNRALWVYPQKDNSFRLHVDSEVDGTGPVHPDNSFVLYQRHTEGAGVELYITGDGYDRDNNTVGGTADHWYKAAAEAFFDIDPYNKLRKYFDVYFIYLHSAQKGVSLYDNKIDSRLKYKGKGGSINCRICCAEIRKALGRNLQDSSAVQVCINNTHNRIGGGVELRRTYTIDGVTSHSIGYGICQTNAGGFSNLVKHETGGHAYGRLLDEYDGKKTGEISESNLRIIGRSPNLDVERDPGKVKWAQFLSDPRYADEELGVYEGGRGHKEGVFRPSKTSMMNRSRIRTDKYNAPSRANIYKIVMRRAFPPDCETPFVWDYETFVKWDLGL